VNPFVYPKSRQQRTFNPRQYTRYQTYKRILRLEFSGKCVYCHMPSSMRGYASFGVDHYRPQQRFPELAVTYSNLYYCCSTCNSAKGKYWPTTAALEKTHFLPNPCDHSMFEHLRFRGATVEARTTQGRVALKLLDLNDPETVEFRQLVLASVEIWEDRKAQFLQKKEKAGRLVRAGKMTVAVAAEAVAEIDAELAKVDKYLKMYSGDPI